MAWLAGFTDGEGYMDLGTSARVVWTTTHRPTLVRIQGKIGGSIRTLQDVPHCRKPRYQLSVFGPTARAMLTVLLPFLVEKRPQADLILSYQACPKGRARTKSELAAKTAISLRLKELRHAPS